ncbi:hypothetical protein [Aquimarina sp. MMG016]|uniref:hypothetical protein n=1 Tax=Aquimarina sp. MMG016 TaxID=2822690 RepID=UPI001B39FFC7|nr:hypothetical protein [Aquimarina sp. MMG016]MBQ4819625.1 hypothetical protein [Aquimarina sp. MMG016]
MKYILKFILPIYIISCNGQEPKKEIIEIENYSSYNDTELKKDQEVDKVKTNYDTIIQNSLSLVGLPNSDIEVRKVPRYGAYAVISKNCKRRFFLYNEVFFDSVISVTKSHLPIKSICFHEFAHHFYRHPLKSRWESKVHELEADRYSGFQMRLIGATLEQSIAAMQHFGNETDTNTHPKKSIRIKEIEAGYIDASIRVFKDSTLIKRDSLIQKNEILYAFQEVDKLNKDFKDFNKKDFEKDGILSFETKFTLPAYSFLGKILIINNNNEVFDLATNEKVGRITIPYSNAEFELLKFEASTYKVENGIIYSMNQLGTPIKLGTKIN